MNKLKKSALLALALITAMMFVGCSSNKDAEKTSQDPAQNSAKTVTLKVGATPVPHKEILEFVKPMLEKKGVNLEIVDFTDYVLPNKALASGEIDANYFQHVPYLEDFKKTK